MPNLWIEYFKVRRCDTVLRQLPILGEGGEVDSVLEPLWQPTDEQVLAASITRFARDAEIQWGRDLTDYTTLHRWSVDRPEEFWVSVWDFCGVKATICDGPELEHPHQLPGACFFPQARLNFARNLLDRRDESLAIRFFWRGYLTTWYFWSIVTKEAECAIRKSKFPSQEETSARCE